MKINFKFQISNFKFEKGFTLVELLIVIAIVGILSALLMVNFVGVRQRGRDAQRKSDMRQMQSAFELFRSDNGRYAGFGTDDDNPIYGHAPASSLNLNNLNNNGVFYMSTIPTGPNTGGVLCKGYMYAGNSNAYTLFTILENSSDMDATAAKPAPVSQAAGTLSSDSKTYTVSTGSCSGETYNYWVNNP